MSKTKHRYSQQLQVPSGVARIFLGEQTLGDLQDGSSPMGSRGEAAVGAWGEAPRRRQLYGDNV